MKNLPTELIYILVFAGIVLFQYMMKRLGPQEQPDVAQDELVPEIPEQAQKTPEAASASSVTIGHFGRAEAPSVSSPFPGRRFSRRALMGTRREMQNAIVIATILGPCRAFEPHDVR